MKQTEIGLIPEDWEVKRLGEILTIKHGYGFEGDSFSAEDNGFIVVTPGNFKLNGGFQKPQASIFYIGKYPKEFNLKPNDLVIMMTDLSKESDTLGNPAIIPDDNYQYLHNQRIGLINCNSDNFDKNYLFHLLCSKDYHKAVVSTAAGSTVKHTSPKRIYTIKLPITQNLQEQQRIAKALSDVDALISTTEKLIQKKMNIKQGTMQNLLTGKKRLPGFTKSSNYKQTEIGLIPEDWEVKEFGDYASIVRGGSPRPIQNFLTTNSDGINWIKIGDVKPEDKYIVSTEEKIIREGKTRSREVHKGDFILSNSMSFGRPYILQIDGCIHDGWLAIQNYQDTFDTDFLYYLLGSDEIFKQYIEMAAGSSVQNLNKEKVAKLLVPIFDKKEQTAIASVLSSMDKEIETLNTKLEKYRNLKTAMMQQLLTGKIRLV